MNTYILIGCDRHDETPLLAAHDEVALIAHAEGLGDEVWDEYMYGYRIAEVKTLQNPKRIEAIVVVLVGVAAAFTLWHRFSNPGLTETQLLLDAWPVYAALAGALVGVLAWRMR